MIRALKRTIQKEHTKLICAIGFATLAVGMPYVAKFWGYQLSTKTSDWGSFGSYIGGLLSHLFAVGSLYYVVETFRQQSFETTFNLLLEQHNSLADSLSIKQTLDSQTENPTKKSTSPIEDALGEIGHYWLAEDPKYRKSLNDNYDIHKYVRVVYQILKFIDENCPSDKLKYSRIFRSFISNDLNLVLVLNVTLVDRLFFRGTRDL
ncbi:TPA: putative phage abortive infection protein [Vibrio diabolicus]